MGAVAALPRSWWAEQGSNLRPPVCKTGALTAELSALPSRPPQSAPDRRERYHTPAIASKTHPYTSSPRNPIDASRSAITRFTNPSTAWMMFIPIPFTVS